ncbi:hypothetical protein SASPL_116792 [Salvia splendens]|uniref:Chaperonin GroES n=1 Tax=Salvia splendens TaxID=180675 RepID=A0A8X8ZYB2_SALSN|nr:hypothetical protein SASPL_116792 [Salvia splendens]
MASSFVTLSRPFASHTPNSHSLSPTPSGLKRRSLKLNAIATKYEPTKVVPQSDRVLIRLEVLPEVVSVGTEAKEVETGKKVLFSDINAYEIDLGTEDRHIFCKASDLLAVVE